MLATYCRAMRAMIGEPGTRRPKLLGTRGCFLLSFSFLLTGSFEPGGRQGGDV